MNQNLLHYIIDHVDYSGMTKLVLVTMAAETTEDDSSTCTIWMKDLAAKVGCSRAALHRHIHKLKQDGVLVLVRKHMPQHYPGTYQINVEKASVIRYVHREET